MPNTPCLIAEGAIGICPNPHTSAELLEITQYIFSTTGHVELIHDEQQMDLVTALSGSGPAYFFYLAEALLAEAENQGMTQQTAQNLIYQTMAGAAAMLQQSDVPPKQLRTNVTSPGGTTAAALAVFDNNNLPEIVQKAVQAAVDRGKELAK